MNRTKKITLLLIAVTVVVLAAVGLLVLRLDTEAVRTKLESRLTDSFGLPVRVQGAVEIHLLPPGVSFAELTVGEKKREILTARRVKAEIALSPLLHQQIRLSRLTLEEPVLSVRHDGSGAWETPLSEPTASGPLIESVLVKEGKVALLGANGRPQAELGGLHLELDDVRREKDGHLTFSGQISADRLHTGRLEVSDLTGKVTAQEGVFRIDPLGMKLFGSEATGRLTIDPNGRHPVWRGELAAEKFSLTELFRTDDGSSLFEGRVNLRTALSGDVSGNLVGSLTGTVRISGTDLIQNGFSLDAFIDKFRQSRDINLVDIGGYVFAGPLGFLVSKGVGVAETAWTTQQQGRQPIEKLVFNWSLQNGIARTEDVAFRTQKNRLAFKGAINLSGRRYEGMTLGLLNAQDCAELTEEISGPLEHPTVSEVGMLRTLAESLVGVFRQGLELIDPGECRPFYQGAVKHPEGDSHPPR